MKLWLAKHGRGFLPTDDESIALHSRMGAGECAQFEVVRPRSLQWHRMYFGICRDIGQNQDPPRDESSIDYELRILAGHYDVMYLPGDGAAEFLESIYPAVSKILSRGLAARLRAVIDVLARGHEVRIPKRIAFHKLTHDEWANLWPSIDLAIRERFGDEYLRMAA